MWGCFSFAEKHPHTPEENLKKVEVLLSSNLADFFLFSLVSSFQTINNERINNVGMLLFRREAPPHPRREPKESRGSVKF